MKKTIILIMAVMAANIILAQTVNVHFKNGQQVQFNSSNVDYVDFSEKAPDPTVTAGTVVDLGLSVYWSSCNLGAEAPEEYGDYFSWGETKPSNGTKDTYSYYDSNTSQYMDIGEDIAGTEYDAATVNLGNDWRMPTSQEMKELIDNCTWEWSLINGISGYKITGTNGNSIFMPAAGFGGGFTKKERLCYYSSTRHKKISLAYALEANIEQTHLVGVDRYWSYPIRPVTNNSNASGNQVDHSNDYLVTDKVSASFLGGAISSINGRITSGSSFNVKFSNKSSESVTLTKIQLNDGQTGSEGNNMLSEEIEVPAGTDKSYTVTVGANGIYKPVISFSYRYNRKIYKVEAEWKSNF